MGRRGVAAEDEDRWVFNRLADAYRLRPRYPAPLVRRLLELSGGGRIVDLGAGTGHLALPLAEAGAEVVAVEPARAMREALAAAVHRLPIHIAAAPAEETGLEPAFDLALIADALHWIDPDRAGRELARLLAPGGAVAVVESSLAETPFLRELFASLEGHNPKARRKRGKVAQLLSLAAPGAAPSEERFRQDVLLDAAGLEGVLRSFSFVGPALGPAALDRVLAEARRIAAAHGGAIWSRELVLTWARRR